MEKCRLIGYGYSTKIYRLYNVKRGRVFYPQDVTSDEGPLTRLQGKDGSTPIDDFLIDLPDGPDDDELAEEFRNSIYSLSI